MNKYIATFHTHLGAMTYNEMLTKDGVESRLLPVPRKLSASCGVCVSYENEAPITCHDMDLEEIYLVADRQYVKLTS